MTSVKFYCPIHKLLWHCESNCCEPLPLSKGSPNNGRDFIFEAMEKMWDSGLTFTATTITIGNKRFGKLSAHDQYKRMARDVRIHMRRGHTNNDSYYFYCFELQQNGQLHSHGIEINTYKKPFDDMFSYWGKRNEHPESFKKVTDLKSYYKYITKECEFKTISNLSKKSCKRIIKD